MWPFREGPWNRREPEAPEVEHVIRYSIQGPAAREVANLCDAYYRRPRNQNIAARQELWTRIHELLPPIPDGHGFYLEPYEGMATSFEVHEKWTSREPRVRKFIIIDTTPKPETEHA